MTAIQLRAELLRELNPIFDSEAAMQKALTALRNIRKVMLVGIPADKIQARNGWASAARLAHKRGDDQLLTADVFEDDITEDWQW